mmetsp:Transcript_47471/g.101344  ORF Transcript_47471/g.101344 Transcript_47471/m.101344 type:complete len:258 (+) Transcript_47471:683-1456(+)
MWWLESSPLWGVAHILKVSLAVAAAFTEAVRRFGALTEATEVAASGVVAATEVGWEARWAAVEARWAAVVATFAPATGPAPTAALTFSPRKTRATNATPPNLSRRTSAPQWAASAASPSTSAPVTGPAPTAAPTSSLRRPLATVVRPRSPKAATAFSVIPSCVDWARPATLCELRQEPEGVPPCQARCLGQGPRLPWPRAARSPFRESNAWGCRRTCLCSFLWVLDEGFWVSGSGGGERERTGTPIARLALLTHTSL